MTTQYKINRLEQCVESLRKEIAETTFTIDGIKQRAKLVVDTAYMDSVVENLQNHIRVMEDEMIGELEILSRLKRAPVICQGDGYDDCDEDADFDDLDLEDQLVYAMRMPSNPDDGFACVSGNW